MRAARSEMVGVLIVITALAAGGLLCQAAQTPPFHNVRDYGAVGDGNAKDTEAIRKAMDAAAKVGGGTVYSPAGRYLTGSIHLQSNITLYLDAGAVLKFSQDFND